MEGCASKDIDSCPQLLDLISEDREMVSQKEEKQRGCYYGSSDDKNLELRLGPPGEEDWGFKNGTTSLSLTHITYNNNNITPCGTKRDFADTWMMKNSETQPCSSKVLDLHSAQKKELSPASANTAVYNSSQKRNAPAAVVGWPPVRSSRKNLSGISSSKPASEAEKVSAHKTPGDKPVKKCRISSFVKINMDGVPIGRKVNLKAYDSYEKLSSAVDELFRDLLTAQRDSPDDGIDNKQGIKKTIIGSGDYAVVYEDNEGDRALVGDIPWHIFVCTVTRLRVVKSSEISTLRLSSKQEKSVLAPSCPKNGED